jgi:hypothetical protein
LIIASGRQLSMSPPNLEVDRACKAMAQLRKPGPYFSRKTLLLETDNPTPDRVLKPIRTRIKLELLKRLL